VDDHPEPIKELMRLLDLYNMYFSKTTEEEKMKVTPEILSRMQEALRNLGYYNGPVSGAFDEKTKNAYKNSANLKTLRNVCAKATSLTKES